MVGVMGEAVDLKETPMKATSLPRSSMLVGQYLEPKVRPQKD